MKRSTYLGMLTVAALATTSAVNVESASINYNASKANTVTVTAQPCPAGATVTTNAATGKQSCGEVTATPLNNRQNLSSATATPGQNGGANGRSPNGASTSAPIVKEIDKATPQ